MDILGLSITRGRSTRADQDDSGGDGPDIPVSVQALLRRTRRLYQLWWFMHYATGLSGVVAGALLTALTAAPASVASGPVASATDMVGMSHSLEHLHEYAWLIGIVAAVATSLVTFLGPLHKAERYWSAYHILEQACLEYRGNDGDPKLGRLMKRVMQVRRILQVADVDEKITGEVREKVGTAA